MTQQEEDRLSNQPTSGITGYRYAIIDSIAHDEMKQFINPVGPFYQYPSKEESGNGKNCSPNISATTSDNAVTIEGIEKVLHKKIQIQTEETTIHPHLLYKDKIRMV